MFRCAEGLGLVKAVRSDDGLQWLVVVGKCGKYRCGAKSGQWDPIELCYVDSFLIYRV